MNYTKGPWRLGGDDYSAWVQCIESNYLVCCIDYTCTEKELDDIDIANAHLISAAPDLYEALIRLMELESRGRVMPIGPEWDAARAALSKAEGK